MSRLRWRKLLRDVWLSRGRAAAMVVAVAISVAAVAAFLDARAILGPDISANYRAGNPASATLHAPGGVGADDVRAALSVPGVTAAAPRGSILARVRVAGGPWQPLLLFVSDPADPQRVGAARVEHGSWPPAADGLFLERTALSFLGVRLGDAVEVRAPGAAATTLTVSGSVHDAAVAPADQERTAYGRLTTPGLTRLGRPETLTELLVVVGDDVEQGGAGGTSADPARVAAVAQRVAGTLAARGSAVTRIDVPPPLRHPHQGQMVTVGFVLLAVGLVALLLSSVLVATMLGGMLTAQIRQIGAMKAVGARTGQLFGLYLSLAAALALTATALAMVPGLALGRLLARQAGRLLNLDITAPTPPWVLAAVVATGIGVPVLVAVPSVLRGTRRTVREAIDDHAGPAVAGRRSRAERPGSRYRLPAGSRTLTLAARNLARRPARMLLTAGLLAVAGTTFLTGLNTAGGWAALVRSGVENRHYDVEVRLDHPVAADRLLAATTGVPGVRAAEAWNRLPATVTGPGIDVTQVYPDDAHGSFSVVAPPPDTALMTLPVRAGRWLAPGDTDAVVLTTLAVAQHLPGTRVGDTVALTVAGRSTHWRVVGVVADFGSQSTAYVTDRALAAVVGAPGSASMVRAVTTAPDAAARQEVLTRLEGALDDAGFGVEQGFTTDDLRSALDGHVFVLIEALVLIALVMGFVGLLGLGSAMGAAVAERTRELGVLQAIGATPGRVAALVLVEGLLTAAVGALVAVPAALPVTKVFGDLIGLRAFRQPLPFTVVPGPILAWTVLTLAGAAGATLAAARRASRLTVRDALTTV